MGVTSGRHAGRLRGLVTSVIVANSDFMKSHRRIPSSLQREPLHSKLKLSYILYNEQNGRELKFAQRQGLVHVRETTGIPTSFIAGSGILDPVPRILPRSSERILMHGREIGQSLSENRCRNVRNSNNRLSSSLLHRSFSEWISVCQYKFRSPSLTIHFQRLEPTGESRE